ncbi:hypothetical protein GOP47_0025141 [Adiantum capillus-veneris]|uniref:Uncharacterized protein n=1 Tax=Adiantum capillus-veneris TaxID=13818 RepID=A0A9D4U5P2_ADICA|nr:hypothetical protein GOP47_0025141 [Adiantum capillus-veneris]
MGCMKREPTLRRGGAAWLGHEGGACRGSSQGLRATGCRKGGGGLIAKREASSGKEVGCRGITEKARDGWQCYGRGAESLQDSRGVEGLEKGSAAEEISMVGS